MDNTHTHKEERLNCAATSVTARVRRNRRHAHSGNYRRWVCSVTIKRGTYRADALRCNSLSLATRGTNKSLRLYLLPLLATRAARPHQRLHYQNVVPHGVQEALIGPSDHNLRFCTLFPSCLLAQLTQWSTAISEELRTLFVTARPKGPSHAPGLSLDLLRLHQWPRLVSLA